MQFYSINFIYLFLHFDLIRIQNQKSLNFKQINLNMLIAHIKIGQPHDIALHDKYRNNKIVIQIHSQSISRNMNENIRTNVL